MKTTIMTVEELFNKPDYSRNGFDIPYYQRGYRWQSDNIKELMDDISKEEKGYCLQPIVINKKSNSGKPQIVDGQQRLTTISLIRKELGCNDDEIYNSLRYNDRNSIDEYFLKSAKKTIEEELSKKNKEFYNKLKECIFIVCTIDASDEGAEKVFLRLNVGKIPLSSAEIFKAYCLTENESDCKKSNFIGIWNEIESTLQNDTFYFFFSHDDDKEREIRYYSTRMDFLLEVFVIMVHLEDITPEKIKTEYERNPNYIFKKLKELFDEDGYTPGKFIKELKAIFDKFQQVYSDIEMYNLFGYLSCYPNHEDMLSLCKSILDPRTESISDNIKKQVIKSIPIKRIEISELKYGENNDRIRKILLLHNALKSMNYEFRFNYNSYRKTNYDLEHIHARAELKSDADVKKFLKDIKREFEGTVKYKQYVGFFKDFEEFCTNYDDKQEQSKLDMFEKCIWALQSGENGGVKKVQDSWIPFGLIEEDAGEWRQTSIMNLCLLPASINRSISNNGFTEKRKQVTKLIHTSEKELPIATSFIFDLHDDDLYGTRDSGMWNKTMGEKYLKDIKDTIKGYIKDTIKEDL